ncbi:MAG TPA: PIG-L family deacetylase [Ohtaekwangia sp.]
MRRLFAVLLLFPLLSFGQYQQPDGAAIKLRMKKLNVLASVLYVAAHPDDENTRIITYMANDYLATAGYLSMTRGDGGQNLIGPEIRDLLGLIRTQELLAARRIDGGEQFFTRANDFGFSKSAQETFDIWGKQNIMADVVKVFRQYQPDVIITRFPPDERAGHGHHTASAILAQEAFDLAADANTFPEQVKEYGTWQIKRLYTNTGRWWNNTINESTPGIVTLHVGGYSPLLGTSFTEIAAVSRSQHKSQGFGSSGTRGDQVEFLEYVKGERVEKNIFENINTTWSRVAGGERIQPVVDKAIREFDIEKPEQSIPILFQIRKEISKLSPGVWRSRKLTEVEQLIQDCLGIYVGVSANQYWGAPGQKVIVNFELVNRSGANVNVTRIASPVLSFDTAFSLPLKNNIPVLLKTRKSISNSASYSDPYWLKKPHTPGFFQVDDPQNIGRPENKPAVLFSVSIDLSGEKLVMDVPLKFKWTDPTKGELYRPFEIVPPVFVNVGSSTIIFSDDKPREVKVTLKSAGDSVMTGKLRLTVPAGWKTEPAFHEIKLSVRDEELTTSFMVLPTALEGTFRLNAVAEIDGQGMFENGLQTISYDHIPTQTLLPKAEVKAVRINLKKEGNVIGYVKGAGDDVPAALRTMGYEVWEMRNDEVTTENLKRVDAVVLGVRAVNTNERIGFLMPALLDYVKNGGTMVVQYNTSFDLEADQFSPYPISISRDRVTEEDAEVRILKPDHVVLNSPNLITQKDFDGWVQERGLYYPNKWDANYEALLSMNDKGEPAKEGSLLVAKYGSGYYVYTGISFFRELPEGVAGSFKLFANLVSLGKPKKIEHAKVKNKMK